MLKITTKTIRKRTGAKRPRRSTASTRRPGGSSGAAPAAALISVAMIPSTSSRLLIYDSGGDGHDGLLGSVGSGQLPGDASLTHDEDAVTHAEDLREFGRDHQDG